MHKVREVNLAPHKFIITLLLLFFLKIVNKISINIYKYSQNRILLYFFFFLKLLKINMFNSKEKVNI